MIDGSEKRNRQLAFELENSHVCEKCSNTKTFLTSEMTTKATGPSLWRFCVHAGLLLGNCRCPRDRKKAIFMAKAGSQFS